MATRLAGSMRPSWAPDTNTTSRKDYTAAILSKPVPDDADAEFRTTYDKQAQLVGLLLNHSAMAPNIEQTFMTPANRKSRVYFMWDFVQRTICYLNMVEHPENPTGTADDRKVWEEAVGRSGMSANLIMDTSGMASMMFSGDQTPWGDEITALARELMA